MGTRCQCSFALASCTAADSADPPTLIAREWRRSVQSGSRCLISVDPPSEVITHRRGAVTSWSKSSSKTSIIGSSGEPVFLLGPSCEGPPPRPRFFVRPAEATGPYPRKSPHWPFGSPGTAGSQYSGRWRSHVPEVCPGEPDRRARCLSRPHSTAREVRERLRRRKALIPPRHRAFRGGDKRLPVLLDHLVDGRKPAEDPR